MLRRDFLGALPLPAFCANAFAQVQPEPQHDFRRVIVAIYYMPKGPRGLGFCPACDLLDADLPRIMANFPDTWFGISRNGKTPSLLMTDNGDSREYRRQAKADVSCYPWVQIYSGTPGDWGFVRYVMSGYSTGDAQKLEQMIKWAAEI